MAKKRKKPIPRNSTQYEQLASEYLIKATPVLDETVTQAHNLYNRALYDIRQAFFKHQYINSFTDLNAMFKKRYELKENMLYHKLGYVQSAQQTLKEVMTVWQAWLRALKTYRKNPTKFTGRPRMPKYLHRDQRHTFYVISQNARVNKAGFLVIPKLSIKIRLASTDIKKIGRVAFKPVDKVIVTYKTNKEIKYLSDNESTKKGAHHGCLFDLSIIIS